MGIQSVDNITYTGMLETKKTHVAEKINQWNLVCIQYLYSTMSSFNNLKQTLQHTEIATCFTAVFHFC